MPLNFKKLRSLWWVGLFSGMLILSGCQGLQAVMGDGPFLGVYHTVQEGQTLFAIAQAYGVDVDRLRRANRVADPEKLQIGRRLWIPGAIRVASIPPDTRPSAKRSPEPKSKSKSQKKTAPAKPGAKIAKGKLAWPVKGVLTSKYGKRKGRMHEGIDIGAKTGTAIHAADGGKVMFSGWGPTGYGRMMIIKHSAHMTTLYAHTSKNLVAKNSHVSKGQLIGRVGATGRASGPHLHFEVRNDASPKNPLHYLPR